MKYFLFALCTGMLAFAVYVYASLPHAKMTLGNYKIVSVNVHETNQAMKYSYDITYPQLKGEKLSELENVFNDLIKVLVTNEIVSLKRSAASALTLKEE